MITYLPLIFGTLSCVITFVTLFKHNSPSHFPLSVASMILVTITAILFFVAGDLVFGTIWAVLSLMWIGNVTLSALNRRYTNPQRNSRSKHQKGAK